MEVIWLVAYDIADDRRRDAVACLLAACGARVQFSVFEIELPDSVAAGSLRRSLEMAIDADEDQVRLYPLNDDSERRMVVVGNRTLEERRSFYIL